MSNATYVALAAIVFLLVGVIVRPLATVPPAEARASIDPNALYQTIDASALPEESFEDLI